MAEEKNGKPQRNKDVRCMPVFKASETIQLILIPPCYRITEPLGVATYVEIPTTIRENILQIEAISVADKADALIVAISTTPVALSSRTWLR